MALAISISHTKHRGDSTAFPVVTATDFGAIGRLKIGDLFYVPALSSPFELRDLLPNRSLPELTLSLRKMSIPLFTDRDADVSQFSGNFVKTAGSGYSGARHNVPLGDFCSVEARLSASAVAGISLQDAPAPLHDYSEPAVAHSIASDAGGRLTIRERGMIVPIRNAAASYEANDRVMIELSGGYVRYYRIAPDRSVTLLRATRSKLVGQPLAELMLFDTSSVLQNVLVFAGNEVSATIETLGVMELFQDWENEFAHRSTAEGLVLADNRPVWTFSDGKRIIRSLVSVLALRRESQALDFQEFFEAHGTEHEFLFVDNAHKDRAGENTEFFARFTDQFLTRTPRSRLIAEQAALVETNRRELIPRLIRTDVPTVTHEVTYLGEDVVRFGEQVTQTSPA